MGKPIAQHDQAPLQYPRQQHPRPDTAFLKKHQSDGKPTTLQNLYSVANSFQWQAPLFRVQLETDQVLNLSVKNIRTSYSSSTVGKFCFVVYNLKAKPWMLQSAFRRPSPPPSCRHAITRQCRPFHDISANAMNFRARSRHDPGAPGKRPPSARATAIRLHKPPLLTTP